MTFLTYAQNCEDVLLWRALCHVQNGFYIDVGANDPVAHSVTKAFYDAGWRGINIEPLPAYHAAFAAQRAGDVNLSIAAGAADGRITLFDVPAVHGWASSDPAVAKLHRAEGYAVTELTVPVRTLANVCAEHAPAEIHFLKVDVEGFEGEVLKGMDFARWRPWVLVIEATLPNSRHTSHAGWEHLVTAHNYRFAWFDGLNRYYVAGEHPELMDALSVQPNVFDDFISYHLDAAWKAKAAAEKTYALEAERANHAYAREVQRADEAEALAAQAHDQVASLLDQAAHQQQQFAAQAETLRETQQWARELDARVHAMMASSSWKVTAPLRLAGAVPRQARAHVRRALVRVTANERLRSTLIPLLLRYPKQAARVAAMLAALKQAPPAAGASAPDVPDELRALPAQARRVLADLQRARSHVGEG